MKQFLERALNETKTNESSNEKKEQSYKSGIYTLSSAFNEFSNGYMRGMGQIMQNKSVMDKNFKKLRDNIATAYERLDDAISKHMEKIREEDQAKATTLR
jgi:transcription termination factor NusB